MIQTWLLCKLGRNLDFRWIWRLYLMSLNKAVRRIFPTHCAWCLPLLICQYNPQQGIIQGYHCEISYSSCRHKLCRWHSYNILASRWHCDSSCWCQLHSSCLAGMCNAALEAWLNCSWAEFDYSLALSCHICARHVLCYSRHVQSIDLTRGCDFALFWFPRCWWIHIPKKPGRTHLNWFPWTTVAGSIWVMLQVVSLWLLAIILMAQCS